MAAWRPKQPWTELSRSRWNSSAGVPRTRSLSQLWQAEVMQGSGQEPLEVQQQATLVWQALLPVKLMEAPRSLLIEFTS